MLTVTNAITTRRLMSAKNIFRGFLTNSPRLAKRAADELQTQRARLGSTEQKSGSLAGLIDRTVMDFNVVISMGDTGVVE